MGFHQECKGKGGGKAVGISRHISRWWEWERRRLCPKKKDWKGLVESTLDYGERDKEDEKIWEKKHTRRKRVWKRDGARG